MGVDRELLICPSGAVVMPGLVPGIHVLCAAHAKENVDGRVKPGHDEEGVTASPNPPYELAIKSLLRCDLPRYRRRRIGEILRQLRVTRLGVLH